jgi:hypothetical protein
LYIFVLMRALFATVVARRTWRVGGILAIALVRSHKTRLKPVTRIGGASERKLTLPGALRRA